MASWKHRNGHREKCCALVGLWDLGNGLEGAISLQAQISMATMAAVTEVRKSLQRAALLPEELQLPTTTTTKRKGIFLPSVFTVLPQVLAFL